MAWTATKTWGVQPWLVGDTNTYLRDNMKSLRNFHVTQRAFVDGSYTFTSTAFVNRISHLNLMPAAPDEATVMYIYLTIYIVSASGSTGWQHRIKDQGGSVISSASYQLSNYTCNNRIAVANVGSGTNPGFSIESNIQGAGAQTMNLYYQSAVWIGTTVNG